MPINLPLFGSELVANAQLYIWTTGLALKRRHFSYRRTK